MQTPGEDHSQPMSKAVILQHVPHEGPGRIVPVFRDFGIKLDIRHLYKGDEVPSDLDEVKTLIVLGGPMSVGDIGNAKYPFLAKELDLLKRAVAIDRAVLGICLGAQLHAHACGAKVYPNMKASVAPDGPPTPAPEFGWLPVTFPFPGGTEPIVMGAHDGWMAFHWHYDTFDLPKLPAPATAPPSPAPPPPAGNALLSSSRLCKNQAFRFKNRLFGFQYHIEFTPEDINAVLSAGKEEVVKVLGPQGEQQVRQDTEKCYKTYARIGDRILRNFVQFLKVY
jgi:GMP synthase-like glutamine amidotransferase